MLSLSKARVTNISISRVELLFVLFLLIFGIPMIVLIPPGAGYDEEDHLVRVWELARFSFIPGQLPPQEMQYPIVFRDFAYRQQGSTGILAEKFWQMYGRASLYDYGAARREIDTKSVYSPALLLPQAIAMRLFARVPSLPALLLFYASRFAGLLSYLVLVWLAIRLIPFGKWILLVLAISPMALFQGATLTPDAISNGIGFLFIAGSLRLSEQNEFGWREIGSLSVLVFLLFLAKLNLIPLILLPYLIIPPARFTHTRAYISLLGITLILFMIEVVGWNLVAAARSNPLMANDANPIAQLDYIVSYPLTFLFTVLKDLVVNGWTYLLGWINGYGYYYWTPPLMVSLIFILGLVSSIWFESTRGQVRRNHRVAFVLVFLAGYLATLASVYLTFTPAGSDQVFGMQGRYFVPLALLLFLVLPASAWTGKLASPSPTWIITFLTIALTLNLAGLFLSFHVPCGSTFYQTGLCFRPLFKDFPSETRLSGPISDEISLTQEIQVACNGFSELRVLLNPSSAGDTGTTRFTLQDPTSKQILVDTSVTNNQISVEDWYPLRFDPDWNSEGKQYVLAMLGMEAPSGQGLRVFYTTQPEFNLGNLIENEQSLQEDIVLQYGCVTGLRKIWLTGKP